MLHVAKGADSIRIPITAGIAGQCCTEGNLITINDPYNDPRFNAGTDKKTGAPHNSHHNPTPRLQHSRLPHTQHTQPDT